MTKQKYMRTLAAVLGISVLLAALFFALMVKCYMHSELLEPFFIAFLVLAFHTAFRLIVGVADDYRKEHHFASYKFPFRKTGLDESLMNLFKARERKDRVLIPVEYPTEHYQVQHYCMAELLHIINIALTLLTFLFCFFADGKVVAFLVILVVAVVFLLFEMASLMANRYARFVTSGVMAEEPLDAPVPDPAAEPAVETTSQQTSAFAGLAAMGASAVAASELKKQEEEQAAREAAAKEAARAEKAAAKAKKAATKAEKAAAKEAAKAEKAAAKEAAKARQAAAEEAARAEQMAAAEAARAEKAAAAVAAAAALAKEEKPVKTEKSKSAKKAKAKKTQKKGYSSNENMSFNALASVLGHQDTEEDFISQEEYLKQMKSAKSFRYGGMSAPNFGSTQSKSRNNDDEVL